MKFDTNALMPRVGTMAAIPFHHAKNLRGLGDIYDGTEDPYADTSTPGWIDSGIDLLKDAVSVYNSQKILDANIDRARRGLPPINTSMIAPTYNVGLSPDAKMMLMVGGLALLAVLLINGGRRR